MKRLMLFLCILTMFIVRADCHTGRSCALKVTLSKIRSSGSRLCNKFSFENTSCYDLYLIDPESSYVRTLAAGGVVYSFIPFKIVDKSFKYNTWIMPNQIKIKKGEGYSWDFCLSMEELPVNEATYEFMYTTKKISSGMGRKEFFDFQKEYGKKCVVTNR